MHRSQFSNSQATSGDIPTEDATEEPAEAIPVLALVADVAPAEAATEETEVADLSGMKPAAPAVAFYLNDDEWDKIDQAREAEAQERGPGD
ncbi:hypothetical protein LDL08_16730 [Nonomuraea glycinis]|uniref:Uncharacterized protein n=1 Tax=Nonomuraea glycinis TaxID=2047744 RepID=A0A918A574_9ACTN|nr:hypothetical protein [Nonomuraea glycinis]MCA2177838.1 hypothetical protein [Nonomuraea glycinis]GGP06596.1 hypothetical protein GCM10012278_30850 [Nonomuraea glycinis]